MTTPKRGGLHKPYKGIIRSQRLNDAGFHFVQAMCIDYLAIPLKGFSNSFVVILSII